MRRAGRGGLFFTWGLNRTAVATDAFDPWV
jgi:hypothetical protein